MNTLVKRSLTGLLFVVILTGSVLLSPYTFGALFLIISLIGTYEFYKSFVMGEEVYPQKFASLFVAGVIFIIFFLEASGFLPYRYLSLLFLVFPVLFFIELYRKYPNPLGNLASSVAGIIYVVVPFAILNYIVFGTSHSHQYHPLILMALFILIWTNDTGAYIVGMTIGKHRMIPRISPNKTWEGTIGGILFTLILAYLLASHFQGLSKIQVLGFAFITSISSIFGDLIESLLKRSVGIKDSGNILPGHGGILDRFDSLLVAAPTIFVYLQLIS
ncbi:MAG TPA: phosphatidate cytidylyltransferase [Bacteroidales bacterium]|nr:phosphatidate cytidylyltransferase [Bacteroidales bacterium]